jgi:hypothetical protein
MSLRMNYLHLPEESALARVIAFTMHRFAVNVYY